MATMTKTQKQTLTCREATLEALATAAQPLTVTEIASITGFSRVATDRYAWALFSDGEIKQTSESPRTYAAK